MIVKLLGFLDILAVIALLAVKISPKPVVIFMALYLIIKGLFFLITGSNMFMNFFDIVSGAYLAAASYGFSHWIATALVIIFLLQKAVISLL